jgi:hypothetical protein
VGSKEVITPRQYKQSDRVTIKIKFLVRYIKICSEKVVRCLMYQNKRLAKSGRQARQLLPAAKIRKKVVEVQSQRANRQLQDSKFLTLLRISTIFKIRQTIVLMKIMLILNHLHELQQSNLRVTPKAKAQADHH